MEMDALGPQFGVAPNFSELYHQYFGFAWASLRRLGVSSATIDDAAQDLWVTVHRRLESLDPTASVKAWLFGIARRVASHYRRSERRNRRKIAAYQVVDPHAANEPIKRREAALTMETFLAKLDESKRVAFVLSEVEGWSAPEIARVAGTNPNTIYSRIRLAKEQLRDHLTRADSELSPKECVDAIRASTAPPSDAAERCWVTLGPQLVAAPVAATATVTSSAVGKLKFLVLGALLGGVGVATLDAALPETSPRPTPATGPESTVVAAVAEPDPPPPSRPDARPIDSATPPPIATESRVAVERPNRRRTPAPSTAPPPADDPAPSPAADTLAQQTRLLAQAQQTLASGDGPAALALLDDHAERYPDSSLVDLRQVLEVQALCGSGREEEARARAARYAKQNTGASAQRLRDACR